MPPHLAIKSRSRMNEQELNIPQSLWSVVRRCLEDESESGARDDETYSIADTVAALARGEGRELLRSARVELGTLKKQLQNEKGTYSSKQVDMTADNETWLRWLA